MDESNLEFSKEINDVFKLQEPGSYCFNEKLFLKKNFHVDKFVSECKDRVALQTLREDLERYYKSIRVALIELINLDYGDFVSLSSNLVGMEKSITVLQEPLGEKRARVTAVDCCLQDTLKTIDKKLSQRKKIREKKMKLQHLLNVVISVEKIEKILVADPNSMQADFYLTDGPAAPGLFLERIAGEFNQLQFHVNQTKGHPLIEKIIPRVSLITSKLQENLEKTFHDGLIEQQREVLLRCLRTYALIDKSSNAEELFHTLIVQPFMNELITEDVLSDSGLDHIFNRILQFINNDCKLLLQLTEETPAKNELGVKGFDFLVRSVWPEIDTALESRLSRVFSPGNPNLFFKRYNIAMKFMNDFELHCPSLSSLKRLRQHSSYNSFMIKWSLPVYFQVRFQEIAGAVERAIADPFQMCEGDFCTHLVSEIWRMECRCWDDEVYIPSLLGRFWKLFLQIISRLVVFLNEQIKSIKATPSSNDDWSPRHMGLVASDLSLFHKKLNEYFTDSVLNLFKESAINKDTIQEAFSESLSALSDVSSSIDDCLISRLLSDSLGQLENTKNIPRLYRRTNRELPSTSLPYATAVFKPLTEFASGPIKAWRQNQIDQIVNRTTESICERYLSIVDELISSIKKTEDSLLRLKRQRKTAPTIADKPDATTDEHRMRRQLLLDVEAFGQQISEMNIIPTKFKDYVKLCEITKSALNQDNNITDGLS